MEYSIIWILFILGCLFLFLSYSKKLKKYRNIQKQQKQQYEENRVKYQHFTSELFDETPDEELTHAVLFHILAKEDKLYEGDEIQGTLVDVLTHSELLIYTIYQVEMSLEGGRGSIHNFFIKQPYCLYRPYAKEAFETVNCPELAELISAADDLAKAVENDEDIDLDDDSDYGTYNFSDFTNAIASSLRTSGLLEKAAKFIRNNKNDFIDIEGDNDE
ncbi:hypothetical protein [uncultured Thomasclavelia sp.]|uniref:hypothetical protein n=1 Tax=uncultured Thomasclavelia sp. TaxID=3025759 RepID=UPI0025E4A0F3|nr:hypothetical protein [uncultured Thomasclavelia sp.]